MSKTRADLFREYARCIDMCEGTTVNAADCVRYRGDANGAPLVFDNKPEYYDFAIDILENIPVFVGDTIYRDGYEHVVRPDPNNMGLGSTHKWSWIKHDEYAHLRKAMAEGKRIAWNDSIGIWSIFENMKFNYPVGRYKIIEDDEVDSCIVKTKWGKVYEARFTKSGLTGRVSVEVVE